MHITLDVLNQLIPNILTVVTQLCATAVLFILLKKLAWKPVHKILAARSDFEQKQLDDAHKLKEETEKAAAQTKADNEAAALQAHAYIEEGRVEGTKVKDQLIAEGKLQAKMAMDKALLDIDAQKQKMRTDMYKDIVDVAMEASAKVLKQKTTDEGAEGQKQAVEDFVKEVMKK
jgi:F-type H+-transporting ATPase subunit b